MWAAALAAVYFAAGKLGLQLAFVNANATAVWPPTGIALAAVLLLGPRVLPGVFLGALLVNLTTPVSAVVALGIATGNTFEALLGALLVQRFAHGRHAFARPADVFRFVVFAGFVATTASATIGVASLCAGGFAAWSDFAAVWSTWWLGDAMGALLFAPLLLVWGSEPRTEWTRPRVLEGLALLAALVGSGLLMAGFLVDVGNAPLSFFAIPVLLWAAFRFGPREAAGATLLLFAVNLLGTLAGHGQFARGSATESLLLLQGFSAFTTVMTLLISEVVADRNRAERGLRDLNLELAGQVEAGTADLQHSQEDLDRLFNLSLDLICIAGIDGYFKRLSPSFETTLGFSREELLSRPFLDFVHPDDVAATIAEVEKQAGGLPTIYFENRYRTAAGDYRWLAWNSQPAPDGTLYAVARDITEQKQADEALAASERRHREQFERGFGLICTHDLDGTLRSINPSAAAALGYSAEEITGRSILELIPERLQPRLAAILAALPEKGSGEGLVTVRTGAGQTRTLMYRHTWIADASPPYVLVHALDITDRVRAEEALQHQATHDPLTGCANRTLLFDHLTAAMARARRARARGNRAHLVALLCVDLDGFKPINDRLGHAAGDYVLREIALRLRGQVRETDTVARLGGDEFVLVLGEMSQAEEALRVAHSLLAAIREPLAWQGEELHVGGSVGVAFYPQHGDAPEALLARADQAMYLAKREGRDGAAGAGVRLA
ncbi:MAG TPA: MASE1 domain-containing protein [Thermoanaerobaculia bacterium]|nr:MASE1 domain-containing protein [Thermoanaerobaculia bacterium]